jgi:plastocyanin
MSFRRVLIAAVVSAAAAACGSSSSSPSSSSTTTTTTSGPTAAVSIPNNARTLTTTAFGADPLTVAVGTTVTWTNNDTIAHNSVADGGMWNSGLINPTQSFAFKFTTAGTFTYKCTIHPGMVGTIVAQ